LVQLTLNRESLGVDSAFGASAARAIASGFLASVPPQEFGPLIPGVHLIIERRGSADPHISIVLDWLPLS